MATGVALFGPSAGAVASPNAGERWVARYNGAVSGFDSAQAIAASPDGAKVFVTGTSDGTNDDFVTIAYNASIGDGLWQRRYNGPSSGNDRGVDVAVSPDSTRVYVTGYSEAGTTGIDYTTFAYNAATGATLWQARYNGLGNASDYPTAIGVSPDGSRVFVTGYSYGGTINYDYATVGYNALTGAFLWERRFDGTDHGSDYAQDLVVSPDSSRVYVTGYADMGGTGNDYVTTGIDAATGASLWAANYNSSGSNSDYADSVAVSPNGSRVFVTGYSYGGSSSYDYATISINAVTGAKQWFRRYNGPDDDADYGEAVAASPDGTRVFVTGYSDGGTSSYDYATLSYSVSTGALLWSKRYNGTGNGSDHAEAIMVTLDGSAVYATGYAFSTTSGNDYASVAYVATTGAPLGVKKYNGTGNLSDEAHAITTNGTITFITGESDGGATDDDYATAAYNI
jgi:dienelactone hydrolase